MVAKEAFTKDTKTDMKAQLQKLQSVGAACVLYGHNYSAFQASKFDYNMSIQILLFVVLGGMSSFRGAMISATVLTILPEMLRGLKDYRILIYAIVLIVIMIFNQSPKMI